MAGRGAEDGTEQASQTTPDPPADVPEKASASQQLHKRAVEETDPGDRARVLEEISSAADTRAGIILGFGGALLALAPDGFAPLVIFGTIIVLWAVLVIFRALYASTKRTPLDPTELADVCYKKVKQVDQSTRLLAVAVFMLGLSVLISPAWQIFQTGQCLSSGDETILDEEDARQLYESSSSLLKKTQACWDAAG